MYLLTLTLCFFCLSLPSTLSLLSAVNAFYMKRKLKFAEWFHEYKPTQLFLTLPSLYRSLLLKKYNEGGSWLL